MQRIIPLTLAALLLGGTASAQDFNALDTNGDGYLTESEWLDAGRDDADFSTVDANGDGYLDAGETQQELAGDGADLNYMSDRADSSAASGDPNYLSSTEDGEQSRGDYTAEPVVRTNADQQRIDALNNRDDAVLTSTERADEAAGNAEPTTDDGTMDSDAERVNAMSTRDDAVVSATEASSEDRDDTQVSIANPAARGGDAAASSIRQPMQEETAARSPVSALDANNDGRLSQQEASEDSRIGNSFAIWDANQDGYLDQREVDVGMNARDSEEVGIGQASFDQRDTDGDGLLSRDELSTDAGSETEFDTMDSNRDGYLDAEEINYDPEQRTPADAISFNDLDGDADQRLSRDEAANDTYMNANFDTWDLDEDGFLDENEVSEGWLNEAREPRGNNQ